MANKPSTEYVFCDYSGYIVAFSGNGKSIGLSPQNTFGAELWLPRSQVKRVTYGVGGDSSELEKHKRIISIEIPRWLGHKKRLLDESK